MAQNTKGIRSVLSSPRVYDFWNAMLGGESARNEVIGQYVKARAGDAVFDIGCGPGSMFGRLPEGIEYVGIDLSAEYIEVARAKFGDRAEFIHSKVGEEPPISPGHFDIAIAAGVLHHLDDGEAGQLFEMANAALKPGGRLVTTDPVYVDGQGRWARFIISKDRGENVRGREESEALARASFPKVEVAIRHDLLRIPYTHIVMICRK